MNQKHTTPYYIYRICLKVSKFELDANSLTHREHFHCYRIHVIIRFQCIIISNRVTVPFQISIFTLISYCTVILFPFLNTTLYGPASKFDGSFFLHRCLWRTLSPCATSLFRMEFLLIKKLRLCSVFIHSLIKGDQDLVRCVYLFCFPRSDSTQALTLARYTKVGGSGGIS